MAEDVNNIIFKNLN